MITPYYGEFTIHPVPLELSLNYCSHRCVFCFANLSSPERKLNTKQLAGLLAGFRERQTLEALLLQQGYPVLVSNRVDAFAHSNYVQALPLLETMTALGIPLTFQTRGGKGLAEALDFLAPAVWYVSFTTLDDDLRAKLEPGAPSVHDRLALLETLQERGHRVVVGFNPAVPEWCDEPEGLLRAVADRGAEGVWLDALHLNRQQVGNLPARDRAILGEDLIKRVSGRNQNALDRAYVDRCDEAARGLGLEVFRIGQADYSDFWRPWRETYPKLFPTQQEFINACHTAEMKVVSALDWFEWLLPELPEGDNLPIDGYLGSIARNVLRDPNLRVPWNEGPYKVPARMGYAEVLALMLLDTRIRTNPVRTAAFSFVGAPNEGGWTQVVDDDFGLPLLNFHPQGTDRWWSDVNVVREEAA